MTNLQIPQSNPLDALDLLNRHWFKGDEVGRYRALAKARALCRRLETPYDALLREMYVSPASQVTIKIGQDLGLFKVLSESDIAQPTNALAQATGSDPPFLRRILRVLASSGIIDETETGFFKATEMSNALNTPGFLGGMTHSFTQVMPMYQRLPTYLAERGYKSPENPEDGPFQSGLNTPDPFFQWLDKHPEEGRGFHDLMATRDTAGKPNWATKYPLSRLTEGTSLDPNTPLVVDVGGGVGKDMEYLRQALLPQTYPLVVQDQQSVVNQAHDTHECITLQAHDFFTPQPIHGARAYFMHSICHDWPDHLSRQILQNIKLAMRPGYSKLLLCESVLPERSGVQTIAAMDLLMMGLLCSKERTKAEWTELLESAGFRIVQIFGDPKFGHGVIEAEPVVGGKALL